METIVTYPVLTLVLSLLVLWLAAHLGAKIRLPDRGAKPEDRDDFNLVLSATLTLLGLIIGFTFSMAISRYDQRKVYEEAEANAIGTEYVRADLLPASNGTQARTLLSKYIAQRILFYTTRDETQIQRINADTARLQNQLWSTVEAPALAQPTPVMALAVAGMNDVLNSQGYTQAAWWNRIPGSAWGLDARHRHLRQPSTWLPNAWLSGKRRLLSGTTPYCLDFVLPRSRHRQPASRPHSRCSAKSGQPYSVFAPITNGANRTRLLLKLPSSERVPILGFDIIGELDLTTWKPRRSRQLAALSVEARLA